MKENVFTDENELNTTYLNCGGEILQLLCPLCRFSTFEFENNERETLRMNAKDLLACMHACVHLCACMPVCYEEKGHESEGEYIEKEKNPLD